MEPIGRDPAVWLIAARGSWPRERPPSHEGKGVTKMDLPEKKQDYQRFWQGEGPCLILIPAPIPPETAPYLERFATPDLMWEHEFRRAQAAVDWPTDGIPTVRPNLGVVFVPSLIGQAYRLIEDQLPWPGAPLTEAAIRESAQIDIAEQPLMQHAAAFYERHAQAGETGIMPYLPDTQGIFDNAQMLYGEQILYDVIDESRAEWLHELLGLCLELFVRVTRHIKGLIGEEPGTMVHGHGTPQGAFFPHAGTRISEDTAILLSPASIEEIVIPDVERAASAFCGAFIHYCGRHDSFFEQLCRSPLVRAIDLQPGMHDTPWVFEQCAATGTVLYSGVAAEAGEDWRSYLRRLADLIKQTGARCILRPALFPSSREECAEMRDRWHEWTA